MQRTCLWNTAGTTPFSKDVTKEQPFMKVLLFLTSSSPPTPSQSPTRTSGCTGLNNGLFVWRKFTGNIKLLLRQERLLHGSQDRRKSRNQMENCASGQKCTCIPQMCKVPPQIPESWWATEQPIFPQHGDPQHLLSLSEKARLLLMDCSSKETVKNFVWCVIFVYLCTIFDMFMYLKRLYATYSFANLPMERIK